MLKLIKKKLSKSQPPANITPVTKPKNLTTRVFKGKGNKMINMPEREKLRIKIWGNDNTITFGEKFDLEDLLIVIKGDNCTITIGDNCKLSGFLFVQGKGNEMIIGNKTTFSSANVFADENKKIIIGEDCMFADNIKVRTSDSHSLIDMETGKRKNYAKDVIIGDHVWVGHGVSILKGVKLNNDCVVATGAVVTKSFNETNCVLGGIPAKIIDRNITWKREKLK